jgi:hypothetical protein
MASPPGEGYDPRHAILDKNGNEICSSHESDWSCVDFEMNLEVSDVNINEWGPAAEMTVSFSVEVDIYRIKVPMMIRENMSSDDTTIDIEVISSDLLRLGLDISGRLLEPKMTDVDIGDESISIKLTASGIEDFVDEIGRVGTDMIHDAAEELSKEDDMTEVDLSGIQIITKLSIGNIGATIGDDVPISMSITIPEFTIEAGVTNGWGGISDGEPTIGIGTIAGSLMTPLVQLVTDFTSGMTEIGKQLVSVEGSGVVLDDEEKPFLFTFEKQDLTIHEDSDTDLQGKVTIIMPSGITLEEFQSANGWEKIEEEDGRQKITIDIRSFAEGDEFSFKVAISWGFVLGQIWAYPAIIMALMIWRIRARRKKKRLKKEKLLDTDSQNIFNSKGGLSDSDFASLGMGEDPTFSPFGMGEDPTFSGGEGLEDIDSDLYAKNDDDIFGESVWDHP